MSLIITSLGLARTLLLSLPNPAISDIVEEANQRLHFDPAICLPHEIVSCIFSYLDAPTLIKASLVSKNWNDKATDIRLWRRLFSQEGWAINNDAVRTLTELGERRQVASPRRLKIRPRSNDVTAESPSVKRARDAAYPIDTAADSPLGWSEQHGKIEADTTPEDGSDHEDDLTLHRQVSQSQDLEMGEADELESEQQSPRGLLLTQQEAGSFKPNWQYLYNQRRRLEQNWINGRFTNFRLPRIEAQHQAHTQCVYTVQYSNRYVVSGSRDKSVRVWDLDTQELKMPPLDGHTGSVLCLQFDERPEQDVIISGGSDADVIVWRFSTGEIIRRLHKAHTDSVLNLRFDERYLVTCSKDKTIRIWNRKELVPTDPEYPDRGNGALRNAHYPDHILAIPTFKEEDVMIYQPSFEPLPVYSLLMTFDGHAAAVNAIQIFKDEVVSASGDRKIMLWNIKNGTLTRTYTGHTKGIACVQYDGRRIVSGSSDNTVRIFDSSTAAEVALLEGHRNLVRTVQAEFGDLPGDAEIQEAEARENDRRLDRTARTRNPRMLPRAKPWLERYFVYGAKLPPGGGGNRWSKIVSGSYDETVLIWRRDRDGRWFIAKELKHEDAMRLASGMSARGLPSSSPGRRGLRLHPTLAPGIANTTGAPVDRNLQQQQAQQQAHRASQRTMNFNVNVRTNGGVTSTTAAPNTVADPARPSLSRQGSLPGGSSFNVGPQVTHQHVMAQNVSPPQSQHRGTPHPLQPAQPAQAMHINPVLRPAVTAPVPATTINAPIPTQTMPGAWPAQQRAAAQQQAQVQQGPNSRVFKLQFDARRIICCSQEPVIVGWDFANGDEAIMEASDYFGEPS